MTLVERLRKAHEIWGDDYEFGEAIDRIEALEKEISHIRSILAATDIPSLPHDYPTVRMAADRMERINDLTLEGLAWIGRHERLEAALREIAEEQPLVKDADMFRYIARAALEGK